MGKALRIFRLTNLNTTETKLVSLADSENITERHFRSLDFGSVLRTDTVPLKFPKDGGRIFDYGGYYFILDAKDADGVKARIQLDIERLNPFTEGYEPSFTGVLEFSADGGYSKEDEYINVKVIDSRKLAKFNARNEIDYNVFDLVSSDNVTMPDFTNPYIEALYKKIDVFLQCDTNGRLPEWDFLSPPQEPGSLINFPANSFGDFTYIGIKTINEPGDRVKIEEEFENLVMYENTLTQDSIIQDIIISGNVLVEGSLLGKNSDSVIDVSLDYAFSVYDKEDLLIDTNLINIDSGRFNVPEFGAPSPNFTVSGSVTDATTSNIDVPEGGRIDFSARISVDIVSGSFDDVSAIIPAVLGTVGVNGTISKFNFYEKTLGWPNNLIRGMFPSEVGSRLIQLMTSETDTSKLLYSNILGRYHGEFTSYPSDGLLSREFATNGYQLRQFVNRALNLNFKDWFRSLSAINPIGLWYDKANDIFKIEDIEEFYKSELFPINLGQIKDIKTTDFKELYFNSIFSGYPKTEYEDFGGVNEVNTLTDHEISIEIKNKFNVRSTYYGDSMGQEFARRKNISKFASEDTKYDNNVYLTTLDSSNATTQGDLFNLSGFIGVDELYNLRKTPRQNLQRQAPLLIAPLYKDESEIISFRKSAKDTNIRYLDPLKGFTINEFNTIGQSGLRERLVDPELDEFEGLYTEDIANEISNDPHRIMPYSDREGNNKYGYIWDVEGNRITGKATYRLIKCNPERIP